MAELSTHPVAVLGAGSWGTALAILLTRNGYPVHLWAHHQEHAETMIDTRCNARYLPGIDFPELLQVSVNLDEIIHQVHDILAVVPSHAFRQTLQNIKPHINAEHRLAWATKGFEHGTCKLLHQVAHEELDGLIPLAVISGPTFAREVASGLPGAVTVASANLDFATEMAAMLHGDRFRAYTSDDVTGVEIGGAVKNVLAIAAGIADGLGFGANTRAALITRGLAEVMRLGVAMGGERETFMGLAGLGDLVLTCTDDQSRNRRLGLALGKGNSKEQAIKDIGQVVEGVITAHEVHTLARQKGVDMPIIEQVYRVLYEAQDPRDAVDALLGRDIKPEQA